MLTVSKWRARWFGLAEEIASWSEDDSTKVGAVIISKDNDLKSTGWNGLPRGVNFATMPERPEKYLYMEHAERNAIYNATRNGISLQDSHIYVTHFPCSDCARAIIQSGIKKVFYNKKLATEQWIASNNASELMFMKAGVKVCFVSDEQRGKISTPQEPEPLNYEEQCKIERLQAILAYQ